MEDCLFCKIANKQIASKIVYESDDVIAFEDVNPVAPYHALFIPKQHIVSMAELTEAHSELLGKLFAAIAQTAHEAGLTRPDQGYRLVTNVGRNAGQSIFHLHFHLLGGRAFAWPPG